VSYFSQAKPEREKPPSTPARATGAALTSTEVAPAPAVAQKANDMVSTLSPGTLVIGNVVCDGATQIFGRVIGDIQAAQVVVGEGARVEGNITAHDVAINGAFKGIVRAHNVKLKGAAVVDGEVFSKSLTVEEKVQFEGVSRRLEKPIELTSSSQAASGAQVKADVQTTPSVQATPSAQATSSVQAAPSVPTTQTAPNIQTTPSPTANVQVTPNTQTNGGKPFSVATSFSQAGSNPGPFSPTGT
jgi:cytoskeletal protein CcmA (bactofilin family)